MDANKSPTPDESTKLGSSLVRSSGIYRALIISSKPGFAQTEKERTVQIGLAKDEYEDDLPFLLVESEYFRDFVHFLSDDAPTVFRATIRRRLDAMYEKEFQTPKEKLDHDTGKFSITIEEWGSGSSFDYLGITLHLYNDEFELETTFWG